MPTALREQVFAFVRALLVAVATALIILFVLIVGFQGQTDQQAQTAQEVARSADLTVRTLRAGFCELGLPIGDGGARDPLALNQCWTNEGLIPPEFGG